MNSLFFLDKDIKNIAYACGRKPEEITLIAVTKGVESSFIEEIYRSGMRNFGESRVQEALLKMESLPKDVKWHFIGRLQKNKVNKILKKMALIHSLDTLDLAKEISHKSQMQDCTTHALLQVNTSGEKSKAGYSPEIWDKYFLQLLDLPGLKIDGLMTMAPFSLNQKEIRACFRRLREFKEYLEKKGLLLPHLSMGMTHDYPIAIEEGATFLRIGSAIFDTLI